MSYRSVQTCLLAIVAALGLLGTASAQGTPASAPTPGTPAACTKEANDWRSAQVAPALAEYRKATDSTRTTLMAKYQAALAAAAAGVRQKAAACAARFSVQEIPSGQLMQLITLYGLAGDSLNERRATERLLSATDLPPRVQAEALLLGMNQAVAKQNNYFGILEGAEQFVAKIDQLPDSLADIKLTAHQQMLGRYEYLDVADGLRSHALAVIALAKTLEKPFLAIGGYGSLARSYADKLMPDSALAILDAAEKELGATAADRFKDFRHRYALIGTKAEPISAEWWINTDAKTVITPAPGRVTLIEFTAHWCGPCKNSYPGISGLAEKFKGKAFDGVMVTSLYGYIGTRQNLTPAQEIEADKVYFGTEHALPFPVAINPPPVRVAGGPYTQPKPDTDYRVGAIPQIIIVDKRGIIRQIVTGWDQGNTARFSKLIEGPLAEQ
ncbi:MAG: TlpA disulfide reductase family protein [Gemmatimonadales bacterium]|nr:TlpA disulfide reductase family protein [Gemmatimonadales bacterium]